MLCFNGSAQFPADILHPSVTMGNFDGVHLGHQELLDATKAVAAKIGGTPIVYTFEPHPVRVLAPEACPPLLQTKEQKLATFETCGMAAVIIEPFTLEFARLSAVDFFQTVIATRLHAAHLVVGYDFTFGRHRQGTADLLRELCKKQRIGLDIIEAKFLDDTLFSSSQIRKLIAQGSVDRAALLLGRPYQLIGSVVPGRGIGGSLGAHTANLACDNELMPADGVYFTRTRLLDEARAYPSITSIGHSPTFSNVPFSVETHLLDVECNLQGKRLAIDFLAWLRGQVAFASTDALKEAMAHDLEEARRFHGIRKARG